MTYTDADKVPPANELRDRLGAQDATMPELIQYLQKPLLNHIETLTRRVDQLSSQGEGKDARIRYLSDQLEQLRREVSQ